MGATETSCSGLLVSAQKLGSEDTDGSSVSAGNSTFTFPANFSKMTNLTTGATVYMIDIITDIVVISFINYYPISFFRLRHLPRF
jgi:hypothetical protein